MQSQLNLRADGLTTKEIAEIDQKFIIAGWIICGQNNTIGSHSFRIYQWEQTEVEPVYPTGYEPQSEPIDLDVLPRPLDD